MKILRSFLIPYHSTEQQGLHLPTAGGLQGNVVEWLGAAMGPQGILLNTVCEEQAASVKTSLVLPQGRAPERGAQKWLFQVLPDGSPVPSPVAYKIITAADGQCTYCHFEEEAFCAGFIGGLFIYVIRDRRGEPGVELVKEGEQ